MSEAAPIFNPFDPAFRADPYPFYAQLREQDPVHVSPFGFVVLTRYDDVARTLRGAEFSRDVEANATSDDTDTARARRRETLRRRYESGEAAKSILSLDPPDHTRLRRLVSLAFTPSAIERLRPRVQQLVDEILDRAADARLDRAGRRPRLPGAVPGDLRPARHAHRAQATRSVTGRRPSPRRSSRPPTTRSWRPPTRASISSAGTCAR